jgi:hypothetical protein
VLLIIDGPTVAILFGILGGKGGAQKTKLVLVDIWLNLIPCHISFFSHSCSPVLQQQSVSFRL